MEKEVFNSDNYIGYTNSNYYDIDYYNSSRCRNCKKEIGKKHFVIRKREYLWEYIFCNENCAIFWRLDGKR